MKPNRQVSFRSILFKAWFSQRERAIDRFRRRPAETQERIFRQLLRRGRGTEFGWRYDLGHVRSVEQFQSMVETFDYETFKPYIEKMLAGERNVTAPGRVKLFARSSGTTSDRSKYIPVTEESLWWNHTLGMRDVATVFAANNPKTKVFDGKTLTLGGSCSREGRNLVGDLSAVLIHETTFWSGWFRAPRTATAIIPDFDRKVEAICRECTGENITAFAGVPSWNLAMMRRVLDYTGRENLLEVWPRLELFTHGGMNFKPYREQYRQLIPSDRMKYMETYNASEGFFGLQDDPGDSSMLLMLDYGVYYEFVPISELTKPHPRALLLEEVETGVNYALVISTNGGLWRYMIGDTIMFTSTRPYKFKITGRTKLFINAFGEELIIDNAIEALKQTCEKTGATVMAFTAAPVFMEDGKKGAHEWIIEFGTPPADSENFANILDTELKKVNSDYEAKRYKDMSLQRLILHAARPNLFNDWLKEKGKLGGQNKVPQLWNDRTHIDELLKMNQG